MQFSVEALEQKTAMKALIIQSEHLEDVEAIIKKLQSTLPPGEVAEIANINRYALVITWIIKANSFFRYIKVGLRYRESVHKEGHLLTVNTDCS